MPELFEASALVPRAASSSRKPLVRGRAGSTLPAAEFPPSITHFPERPKRRKAVFRPLTLSLAYIARPGGGGRRSWESQSYPRQVSGESLMSLPGTHNRFGLCNGASKSVSQYGTLVPRSTRNAVIHYCHPWTNPGALRAQRTDLPCLCLG